MSLRPPQNISTWPDRYQENPLFLEIQAEKAASLGRAGRRAEEALARLHAPEDAGGDRTALLREAAEAVYAYFLQREFCGLGPHDDVIRELRIPREVLVRLGAS